MTEVEPPTDDLRALFATERDVSAIERAAIRNKLAVSIAAPAPAAAAIATSKLVWIAAAAIATAAGIWWLTHRDKPAPSVAPPPTPVLVAPAPEPTITTTVTEPTVVEQEPVAPEAAAPVKQQPSQADLLAKAWQAVDRDPTRALALVELDAKLHAKGALAEERDALHVHALVVLGNYNKARGLATTFLARYPKSVHRARVERAFKGPR
ncbi:MAG TPA: hypothetical protein VIV11_37260 [Kofleriaceae bacterium]